MSFRKYEIPNDFKALPLDITYKIFSYLSAKDLSRIASVSKWFYYFSSIEELWKSHCKRNLNCKLQRVSPSWKQHYLDIFKLVKSLNEQQSSDANTDMLLSQASSSSSSSTLSSSSSASLQYIEKITFSLILKIKKNFEKEWENILLSLVEHSTISFNIFTRCIDTSTKEIFASFLHWVIANGSEITVRWLMEYCSTVDDGLQRALLSPNTPDQRQHHSPPQSGPQSTDYTPPLLLASYLGKESIVKFILEWLDAFRLTEEYSNEGISQQEIYSIVHSNPIIVPRTKENVGRSNSYKFSSPLFTAFSPPSLSSASFTSSSKMNFPASSLSPSSPSSSTLLSSFPKSISSSSAVNVNNIYDISRSSYQNSPLNSFISSSPSSKSPLHSTSDIHLHNHHHHHQNNSPHNHQSNNTARMIQIPPSKLLIIQRGAGGTTALQLAAGQGHFGIVKYLLEKGADPNAVDKNGNSPLHAAAIHGYLECLQVLIENGGNYKLMTKRGRSILHLAVVNNQNAQVIDYLLTYYKVNVNKRTEDEDGYTPLHIAAKFGVINAVKILLKNGADIHARSIAGNTPLQEASRNGQTEIVRLLKRYEDNNGFSAVRGGAAAGGAGRVIINDDGCAIS